MTGRPLIRTINNKYKSAGEPSEIINDSRLTQQDTIPLHTGRNGGNNEVKWGVTMGEITGGSSSGQRRREMGLTIGTTTKRNGGNDKEKWGSQ